MIILYNPPSTVQKKRVLPMSLLAVGAVLEGEHDYVIIDGNVEPNAIDRIGYFVREKAARVLAVTVMPGPQLRNAVSECKTLKKLHPHLIIVWGGYFPTQHWDVCLKADYVDYVIRGHGELVFKKLLDEFKNGFEPSILRGLAYRNATAHTPASNPLPAIPHPDELPDFPYHRVDMSNYVRPTFMGERTMPHHSSYGCPFFCNFCAVVNLVNGKWLAQSAERTANTTEILVKNWQVNAVEFYDNNFFTKQSRVAEFADRIEHLGIHWWGEARIDTLLKYSENTWDLMARSGLKMVFLGAESGSDETLQRMDKGGSATVEKTLDIAGKMRQYGIIPEFSFVLGNPPEPEKDTETTIDFIKRVKKVNPQSEIIMYLYSPVPLSGELYENAKANGFEFPETLEEWVSDEWQEFSQRRSLTLPWIKDPLTRKVRNFERVLNAYYPTSTDMRLTSARRALLRTLSAWRYHTRFYKMPLELQVLQRFLAYQRPETSGF
ncbi:B12-binding domain-containing radical SAM protein [candidate division KSB1 bacterium]|nr:B12-binding domain-containing radical SAM protein [candidate division KSB1 bacterium]NIR69279.1 B12-binding domain-containing radical SAM protein [candidate division KSB1 bacterium]NIS24140.1 B12-binding domain-containing radical SAM protein [candidate division KSB1 bacterium]NIT71054.1 B12-binding domain-containing radical SAM protein [candidate division KSB1 bacterium]NIU24759.1 B12-binding domain-containing radical SAM protein [candidate division KSB1 bacterium]